MPRKYGSREDVWSGNALMTKGKLKRADLFMAPNGVLKSKRMSMAARRRMGIQGGEMIPSVMQGGEMIPSVMQGGRIEQWELRRERAGTQSRRLTGGGRPVIRGGALTRSVIRNILLTDRALAGSGFWDDLGRGLKKAGTAALKTVKKVAGRVLSAKEVQDVAAVAAGLAASAAGAPIAAPIAGVAARELTAEAGRALSGGRLSLKSSPRKIRARKRRADPFLRGFRRGGATGRGVFLPGQQIP